MLDRYWWGQTSRISPEAPVPVVLFERSTVTAGGAANVAVNVAGLGAKPYLVGAIGVDEAGQELRSGLVNQGVETAYLVEAEQRPTTVKTRIVAHGQHVVRIDVEDAAPLPETLIRLLLDRVAELLPKVDVVICSDYAKGLLTPALLNRVIAWANDSAKPILVDPKGRDYRRYARATLLTPNQGEAFQAGNIDHISPEKVVEVGKHLLKELQLKALLITQGADGMTLFQDNCEPEHLPAQARNVYDVTGAGDTVVATLAVALGAGLSLSEAARLANIAAGIVVGQLGTTTITWSALQLALTASELS